MKLALSILMLFIHIHAYSQEIITEPERTYGNGIGSRAHLSSSLDGSKVAVTSKGCAYVWDTSTWELIGSIQPNSGKESFTSSSPSADGRYLLTGGTFDRYANAILWDLETKQEIRSFHLSSSEGSWTRFIFLLPDEKRFLAQFAEETILVDIKTGDILKTFPAQVLTVSPDGKTFYSGSLYDTYTVKENPSYLWDIETGQQIKSLPQGGYFAQFSPDGTKILTKTIDSMKLIDVETGNILHEFSQGEFWTYAVTWNQNKVGFLDSLFHLQIYSLTTGQFIKSLPLEHTYASYGRTLQHFFYMAFSPDGNQFIYLNNRGVSLYDADTGAEIKSLTDSFNAYKSLPGISYMEISQDENLMLLTKGIKSIVVDLHTGKVINYLDRYNFILDDILPTVKFMPNLDLFYTFYPAGDMWKITDKEKARDLRIYLIGNPPVLVKTILANELTDAIYLPQKDQFLLTNHYREDVRVYDVKADKIISDFPASVQNFWAVTNEGSWFLSRRGGFIKRFDLQTGEFSETSYLPEVKNDLLVGEVSISNDNQYILNTFGILWDSMTGDIIQDFNLKENALRIAISPNNKYCAFDSGQYDGTVRIFSTETGEELYRLRGHNGIVTDIHFTADSNHLYTSGNVDSYVKYWSLTNEPTKISNWNIFE